MRQVGQLSSESHARRFVAWLTTQQIDSSLDQDGNDWTIWVRDEDKLDEARTALQEFSSDPTNARYAQAEKQAEALRREYEAKREQSRRNQVQMRDRWGSAGERSKRTPVVLAAIVFSAAVFLLDFLMPTVGRPLTASLAFSDPISRPELRQQLSEWGDSGGVAHRQALTWHFIRTGQVWRIFTPMFLHGSILHLVFNMYMLNAIGAPIENRYGSLRMLLLMLFLAAVSSAAQASFEDWRFVGMSGVVYGLLGFAWIRSTYDPDSRLHIDPGTVFILLLFFFIFIVIDLPVFRSSIGSVLPFRVANWAHGGGLVAGMALGFPWLKYLRAKRG
jgi:GlpG protein